MVLLKQHPIKIYGNDCMIYKDIALLKSNEEYLVIVNEKQKGWCADTNCKVVNFKSYADALRCYENCIE